MAAASPLFRAALSSTSPGDAELLLLPDFSPRAVLGLLRLLHEGTVRDDDEGEELLELLATLALDLTQFTYVRVSSDGDNDSDGNGECNVNVAIEQADIGQGVEELSEQIMDENNNYFCCSNDKCLLQNECLEAANILDLDNAATSAEQTDPPAPSSSSSHFPCALCSRSFSNRQNLRRHLLLKHRGTSSSSASASTPSWPSQSCDSCFQRSRRIFPCADCGASFTSYRKMYDHRLKHLPNDHPNKPRCGQCGKIFANKSSLRCVVYSIQFGSALTTKCISSFVSGTT